MKRTVALLLILVMIFTLTACGDSSQDSTIDDTPDVNISDKETQSLRNYDVFIADFKELLLPLSDYTLFQLSDVPLDDGLCHVFYIEDTLIDDIYRLSIYVNNNSDITSVIFSNDRKSYGNLQFAVFASYLYKSMGFPEIDANSFYEQYDLFSKESIFEVNTCGAYVLSCMAIDSTNEITFFINIPSAEQ